MVCKKTCGGLAYVLTLRICDLEYPEVVKPAIPQPSDPAIPPKEKNRDYPALIEKVSLPY